MAQVINTNIASLNAQRNLTTSQSATQTAIQRLSTGLRINSAKDDAAGLAISERFKTQINGLNQAVRNANDGISLAQTAEGALGQIGDNLQRIRTLSVQSRNATNSPEDRAALQKEVTQLTAEIDRVAKGTEFNGTKLIDGSFTSQAFQVGANQGQTIDVADIANANTDSLGSWTSVATSAVVNGAAAPGSAIAAVDAKATLAVATVAEPTGAAGSVGYSAGSVTIGNNTFTVAATTTQATAAAAKEALLTNIAAAVNTAAQPGLTATTSGTGAAASIVFTNSSSAQFSVTATNVAGTTNVKAQTPASASFAAIADGEITINGTSLGAIGATTNGANRLSALADAINNKADTTGVKATIDSGRLKLSSDGKDIVIAGATTANTVRDTGLITGTTATTTGQLAGSVSFAAGKQQVGFANLDISTIEGADNAIKAMDAALKSVNESRANLGAIQNRFSSVVSNLQTTSENLSSSRSRIVDADFAEETAAMTRNQILQQAGTAMLAQANSLPNNVLTLLRG